MKNLILLVILTITLSSCAIIRPHKKDVDQGNVITASEVERLHTGMSEGAVRDVMGDPITINIFEDNRLNYVYTMQRGYENMKIKRVVCVFEHGRLVEIKRG
ncbi:MAG TPA: outer membrane protein assembly factor BamE [Gammaproteobacteria bacterium]|jgi:outer membrane protein assembly factor BamE|nr:outer membrane protein assembly factor BamE [Gammaproteobacteria bacterium]